MRKFIITVNGQQYDVEVEEVRNGKNSIATSSMPIASKVSAPVAASAPVTASAAVSGSLKVNAPMPGSILKINVNTGDVVKKGQALIILEAMKMENEIVAPSDGKIAAIKEKRSKCKFITDFIRISLII